MQTLKGNYGVTIFSLTNEILAADFSPLEILDQFLSKGITKIIELDGPQHFRNFPNVSEQEISELAAVLAKHSAEVQQLGIYVDRAVADGVLLSEDQVVAELIKQIELAKKIGAKFVRLGLGFATQKEISLVLPALAENQIELVLEVQGTTLPTDESVLSHLEFLQQPEFASVGLLFDLSLCMKVLPPSYLTALSEAGFNEDQIEKAITVWQSGDVGLVKRFVFGELMPAAPNTFATSLALTLATRMGHTKIDDWQRVMPLVRAVHLKFWDTHNEHHALTGPMSELLETLMALKFDGPLICEWGGHEWSATGTASTQVIASHKALFDKVFG
jgi:hypothetical protein